MQIQQVYERLQELFPGEIVRLETAARDPWIEVQPAAIVRVATALRDDPDLRFQVLSDLCAVDYLELDPKKKDPVDPHLEVVYHVLSLRHRLTVVLKVRLPRWGNDRPGDLPELPSVSSVWNVATWHEREAYDLLGVRFTGHPQLTRILCPEDWVGHPLRKDYEMPDDYHGIRVR